MSRTIAAIYGARKNAGIQDDDTARDLYERETGKRSLRLMSVGEQVRVLQALQRSSRLAPKPVAGPYAKKLQALWLDGWNLGIVTDHRDSAMLAFVARQTDIERTEFLRDPKMARKALEGLKKWIERAVGVDWGDHADPMDAVIATQVRILKLDKIVEGDGSQELQAYLAWRGEELDRPTKIGIMRLFGEAVRKSKSS